jgi:hypothetical protein
MKLSESQGTQIKLQNFDTEVHRTENFVNQRMLISVESVGWVIEHQVIRIETPVPLARDFTVPSASEFFHGSEWPRITNWATVQLNNDISSQIIESSSLLSTTKVTKQEPRTILLIG